MTRGWTATALALAYLLVVQAILGGLGHGAHAADRFEAARFGGAPILCSGDMLPGSLAMPTGPDGAPARHAPDCCTLGCLMAAGALPAPLAAALPVPDAEPAAAPALPAVERRASLARASAQARAPPLS